MKKLITIILLIASIFSMIGCKKNENNSILSISPEISEYWTYMSSTPGIELTAVFTLDLKNSNIKYHWKAEEGTFLQWHGNDKGMGRIEDLGNELMTNVHKLYWSEGSDAIIRKSFIIYLTVEDIYSGEVIAEASIQIDHPEEGHYTIGHN